MSSKITFTFNLNDPATQKAIKLAEDFSRHCKENNFPDTLVIGNVAHNASAIKDFHYLDGKKYEKERLATFLGLTTEETS